MMHKAAAEAEQQCGVIADVTSASCEAEARRDSGISVASSLMTSCMSEMPVTSQHAAIIEEPSCDVTSASGEVCQPAVAETTDNTVPAVLPWISLPTDQGYHDYYFCLIIVAKNREIFYI